MEKLLPHNIEAEQGVLGSLIIDPEAMAEIADFLRVDDFYREIHRHIYQAMLDLYMRREPADLITLCDELGRRDQLEQLGGQGYIAQLTTMVPTSANVAYYGHIVERGGTLRRLIHAAGKIAALAYTEADADEALDKAQQMLYDIANRIRSGNAQELHVLLATLYDRLESAQANNESVGLRTGLRDLDRLIGGLQPSDLMVVAARPAVGKTSFALSVAYWAAMLQRARILVFSLEMSQDQLVQRLLSMESGIDSSKFRDGRLTYDDWDLLSPAVGKLSQLDILVDDTPGLSLMELRTRARRAMLERRVDLVLVDYLQLMTAPRRDGNRVQEVSEIARGLKNLARELQVPVMALAQLSRAAEHSPGGTPLLSHLRESGEIEQAADIVLFLNRKEIYDDTAPRGVADLIVAKHRHGPTGEVQAQFEQRLTLFRNLAPVGIAR